MCLTATGPRTSRRHGQDGLRCPFHLLGLLECFNTAWSVSCVYLLHDRQLVQQFSVIKGPRLANQHTSHCFSFNIHDGVATLADGVVEGLSTITRTTPLPALAGELLVLAEDQFFELVMRCCLLTSSLATMQLQLPLGPEFFWHGIQWQTACRSRCQFSAQYWRLVGHVQPILVCS